MRSSDWSSDVCSSDLLGTNAGQSIARYTINASGTGFAEVWNFYDSFSGFSVKDANAKSRLLPISATQYATVNTSSSDDFGIVVKHRQQIGRAPCREIVCTEV